MSDHAPALSDREAASTRVVEEPIVSLQQRSRWPGWVWAVPVAAVAIVAWLAYQQITTTGPRITVVLSNAGGVGAGTSVQYQGMNVGQVESVEFEGNLQHVRARIRMVAAMKGHLGPGTQFWIAGPSLTNLSSIKSIISGPSIEVLPQTGAAEGEYVALAEAPLMEGVVPGRSFVLHARDLGNISRGSAIMFRDLNVGNVQSSKLLPDETFQATIFVEAPYDRLVREDSWFWSAGAVQFSLRGNGPRLEVPSPGALLTGAIAFDSPADSKKAEAAAGHAFTLYTSREEAATAPGSNAAPYRTVFGADGGGLAEGAPVMLAGKQVGTVTRSELRYDRKAGALMQPVSLLIDPSRLGLPDSAAGRSEMAGVMKHLVEQGLRAQPGAVIPMLGPADVELTFVHDAPAAELAGDPPELPVAPGGGGVQGILMALNAISNKIGGLPIDQIAADIHVATARLADLSQSPRVVDALETLDRAVANFEHTSASMRAELPAILYDLRETVRQAESTVAETRQTLATLSGQGTVGLNSASLSETLYELTRAAQAMRGLADYLDRNPSALVRGRE